MATSRGNLKPGVQEADILNVDITTWTIYPISFGIYGDTFYTQTEGSAKPGVCTGLISWISDTPGGAPIANGAYGDSFNISNTDTINLHWSLSNDPANTTPYYANLALADYALQYRKEPYYLNVMNANAACLANVSNCNITVPEESINKEPCVSGTTFYGNTSWQSMTTTASFLCDTYPGEIYPSVNTVTPAFTNWVDGTSMYYPFGSPSTELTVDADTVYKYQFYYTNTDPSKAYSFRVNLLDKIGAEAPGTQFWIEQGSENPVTTTNGCPAIRPGSVEGTQLLLNLRGDPSNHDVELDASLTNFFINIQTNDQTGNVSSIAKRLEVAVYEQEANTIIPGTSTQQITPVMLVSGKQTAIEFPESGEYLVSATITDDKGIIYKQNQTLQVDVEGNTRVSYVDARDPHYDETKTITRGFLGYGPGYKCKPGNYKNDLRYKSVGESFSYNSVDYNMTQNMATCLTFNCLDECLGVNTVQAGPNGLLSKGTIDNCEESYYGEYEYSNEVLKWNTADFNSVYLDVESDILSFPLVIPTKEISGTNSVKGQFEVSGNNTLMWISTEPGGGPHNCFGYLDSYGNYYSFNGIMKFYATYNNAIMADYAKSHTQLTMGQTYYINVCKIIGNTQKFLSGEQPIFSNIKNLTVQYTGMTSLVRKDKLRTYNPAMGVAVGDRTPGTSSANVSYVPEVEPLSPAYTERYGICAEEWDDEAGSTTLVKVAPRGRIVMPFTTTKRMYKGQFSILNFNDTFDDYNNISAYIIDTPEKLKGQSIGRVINGKSTFNGYTSLVMNLEVAVDNYATSSTSDVVLEPFTTYYLVLDNNTNQTFTANRHLQMEYSSEYGEPETDYDLYPPWCINTQYEDIGSPSQVNLSTQGLGQKKLAGDVVCQFSRNQTVNVYRSGQRFTIKGQDLICTRGIADCLESKTTALNIPDVQDVMQCAGIFYDSLNPDTPEPNPLERGGPARGADNVDNFGGPDAEIAVFSNGSGLNSFSSAQSGTTVLTGGAASVDDRVREAINNKDFSSFNSYGLRNTALTGPTGDANWQEYLSQFEKYGNYSGFSNHPLTGNYDQLPSTFKIRKRKVKNPLIYGFEIPLKEGRYVNATSQRITGGTVKQLAKPLKIVSRTPKPLKTYNVRDEAFGKNVPSNLNETYRNTYYNPRGVGAYFSTKGKKVQNIANNGFIASPVNSSTPGFLFGGGPFDPTAPGTAPRIQQETSDSVNQSQEEALLPDELQPIAQDLIYAPIPEMTMQPLKIDDQGNYVPAGPEAKIDLRQPTPQASFTALQAKAVADGSELFINERKIVFRNGSPLEDIKTQINCGKFGVNAIIGEDTDNVYQDGTPIKRLVISSCSNSPWTVANGCGGGIFQQVGDFHVNRGFENTRSITSTFIPAGSLDPQGGGEANVSIPFTDPLFPGTGRLVDITFDKNAWNNPTYREEYLSGDGLSEPGVDSLSDLPSGAMFLPTETVTLGGAGQGYRVGDRLRLVGGTPVNSNKGPLTRLCIDVAGAGYVDPEKIDIIIGDGSTPGIGAEAIVTSLDLNGGIADIEMLNYGIGYDPGRPPVIQIIDKHSDQAYRNQKTVNALNQFNQVTLSAGDVFKYEQPSIVADNSDGTVNESYIDVELDYYRISNTQSGDLLVGGINSSVGRQNNIYYGGNTVDGNYPTIDIATGQIYGELQHTEYKAVIGMPQNKTVLVGQYIRLVSTGTGANAAVVANTPDLLVSDHMIGKDGSNNDTIALNMPIVRNRAFLNASTINKIASEMAAGNVTVEYAKVFQPIGATFIPVAPYGIPKVEAEVSGIIGVTPERLEDGDRFNPDDPFYTPVPDDPGVGGFRALGGPQRVAKFLVTQVDSDGGIVSLKLLDRGLYRIFPSDLTFGIPLEYDVELLGVKGPIQASAEIGNSPYGANVNKGDGNALGGVDPLRNNIVYGFLHPEYWNGTQPRPPFALSSNGDNSSGARQGAKHPDWVNVGEYKVVSDSNGQPQLQQYWGSPGAYDPTTFVLLEDGSYQPKTKEFVVDPVTGIPLSVRRPERTSGGQGARVFLTAQDVPDCSEEGDAQEKLGLPDTVTELDGPRNFVRAANNGLVDVGYLPPDINWGVDGDGVLANVTLNSIYPGVRFNGLDWFGIPSGDYAAGALCVQATLSSPNLTTSQIQTELEKIYQSSDAFGLTQDTFTLPNPEDIRPLNTKETKIDSAILSLLCIDSIETDPNSVFGDGPVFNTINELYKYDITNIFGQEVKLDGVKQDTDAFIFESRRYGNADSLNFNTYYEDIALKANAYVTADSKLWIDSLTIDDTKANIELAVPGFINGGWAYVENGQPKLWQTPMVDTRYIHNSIIYDPDTGARTTDLYPWDPFKGVLPGFIDKEIDYISESDPVVYNIQRHQFGPKQVGAVWWDTSSIRYQWYEQGTNVERWKNWGRAFPGSTIIVCEWVESRAKPQNWNGDGTPRWLDQFITERRWDPVKQEYQNFYYYWVMNRTTVDARLRESRNRKYDTRTIARYLSDPVGFGIHMISFLSSNAVMFSNLSDVLRDSGNHVQINLARDLDPDGIKHTAWKLIREDDDNSVIPENITLKLTDSLAGENLVGEPVPDPGLSSVMSYGAKFRPRQSMFVNIKEARRTMAYVLNEVFANLKLYTDFPTWNIDLPAEDTWQYIERVNYYEIIYTDENTNEPVRYDDSYKPIFNVDTVSDLESLTNLPDGTVVQVQGDIQLAEPQLWIYSVEDDKFTQIAIVNDTIRFKDEVFTDETNSQMSFEIRNVLNLFNDDLFQRFNFWNILFFEMLKYAYMEQKQLDWAFKTSYLYVEKEEVDLIQISGFKPDNYEAILNYMDEAKPYSSKVREYRDGKSPPIEIIGTIQPGDIIPGDGDYNDIGSGVPGIPGLPGPGPDGGTNNGGEGGTNPNAGLRSVSDYDKPPYPDPDTGTVRILDDFNQADRQIMSTNPDYINYFSVDNKADDPIRHITTNLTYDRTNWRFTEYLWNANTVPLEHSITNNIVNLTTQTAREVAANANVRAIDRIFKFDPGVINQFNLDIENNYPIFKTDFTYQANSYVRRANQTLRAEFDLYKANKYVASGTGWRADDWDLQEAPYTEIITNVDVVYDIVESGNLNFTLALLKNKVGGDWQGETLDANVFTKVVPGADPTYDYQTQFGYGTEDYEQFYWDVVQEVNNYVGIFKEPPEVNLRRNDRDYDGFDGISFLRVLYGEERPEELVQVDPYETFIVNCVTNTETAVIPIGHRDEHFVDGANTVIGNDKLDIDPPTGVAVFGLNGNIVFAGGTITEVNLSDDLIDRSYGTCRAVSIEAVDESGSGSGAQFSLKLQTPPDGWPASASWPQMASIEVVDGGQNYAPDFTTVYITVALNKNANPVQFQIFESLFGQTDYGRVRDRTLLAEDLRIYDEEIVLEDPSLVPDPLPGIPGYLWIEGSELIKYERKNKTTGVITQFQRGAEGTTIQDWYADANTEVWDGSVEQKFNDIDPWRNIWLDQGFRYDQLYNWDDNNYDDNDDPGNIFVITNEAVSGNLVVESNIDVIVTEVTGANIGTGWQPGWDYGNLVEQTCNVTSITYLEQGRARLILDCEVPQGASFVKITTDFEEGAIELVIDETPLGNIITLEEPFTNVSIIGQQVSGNGNVISNVQLIPAGNDEYDPRARVRSNVFVTGTATGNISITEIYNPVIESNINVTAIASINGQNVFAVANTINNLGLPTVEALVEQAYMSGIVRDYLSISGRSFIINEIDTPTLHIEPGRYEAEYFESVGIGSNTLIVDDDIWVNEAIIAGMSNTLVTYTIDLENIPWDYANAAGFPALSLADLANTDSTDTNSIMKFLHGVETESDS